MTLLELRARRAAGRHAGGRLFASSGSRAASRTCSRRRSPPTPTTSSPAARQAACRARARALSHHIGAALMLLLVTSARPSRRRLITLSAITRGAATGRDGTENLFATIPEFTVFSALFDWAFVLAAGGSLVVRWAAERVK
ncbi:hypothetical protein B0H17DRAFT_1193968 [Mycena rosella]|uniref:Uncharacterized protein n=1 Tax=Mycena rosella TaxID=1033263 RepID=A0AAD7GS36_MYCRO|nr:hypothetical protein B0H17DRAFT_1193968 [Mycena rosella]